MRRRGFKIELSTRTVEDESSTVVGTSSVLGGGEGAEPFASAAAWFTDLSHPFTPATLPHSSVPELVVIWTTFAFVLLLLGGGCGGGSGAGGALFYWERER